MKRTGFLIAILTPLLVLAVGDWTQTKDKNDIITFIGPPNDTGLRPTRSKMVVRQTPEEALHTILDFSTYTSWVPYCEESKTMDNQGDTLFYFFQLLDMPLVKNRDMYIKVEVDESDGDFYVTMTAAPTYKEADEGAVRIELLNAKYRIYSDEISGLTKVEMENEVDPGGYIPTFALNWAGRSQPFETFTSLREHMALQAPEKSTQTN